MVDDPTDETESEQPFEPRPDPFLTQARGFQPNDAGRNGAREDNRLAPLALASALASFVCLPVLGGLLAIGLGMAARGEMRRLRSRQGGGMALAAILLGGMNLLVSAVVGALVLLWVSEMNFRWPDASSTAQLEAAPKTGAPPRPVSKPVRNSRIGNIEIVDIHPGVSSLGAELERQQREAAANDKRVLVWLVGPRCAPCEGVAQSLPHPALQEALGKVVLVRINAADFQQDLARLRIPHHAIPGFALLGSSGRPIDYVHGGEWDEDVAANIAPVLGKFVRGEYTDRRYPWRGGVRDDETAL